MTTAPLLSIRRLTTEFHTPGVPIARAVEDVSFDVFPGQTVGLVGESGCGKTTILMSILRLLPASGRITSGKVLYKDVDLLSLDERQMRSYRWKEMAIVFQGAMSALNPVMKVGDQIREAMVLHDMMEGSQAEARVAELLELVGIPKARKNQYPHEYSGGMRQRAMIAMALACAPDLLFADEPTTALDVMIQAQILALLKEIQKNLGLSIVLVTHDLGVVAEICDSVVVMYGGKVAESGKADQIYNDARHPYTRRLLASFPDLSRPAAQLTFIPGMPPRLTALPGGCRFHPRCPEKINACAYDPPPAVDVSSGHRAACHLLIVAGHRS